MAYANIHVSSMFSAAAVGFVATTAEEYARALAYVVDNAQSAEMRALRERARRSCSRFSDGVFEDGMVSILKDGYI